MSQEILIDKIKTLVEHAWDHEVRWPHIEAWLQNFDGVVLSRDDEQLYALFALSRFMYFGRRLVREMLKSLYRDHFEAPLVQRIRRNCGGTKDIKLLGNLFQKELDATRFLGIGNPAESGAHLLYFFRQVNYLKKDLFIDFGNAFTPRVVRRGESSILRYVARQAGVTRYVFFDDLVGSGSQASGYLSDQLANIRRDNKKIELIFMSLFATTKGLARMNAASMFDGKAMCLFELDDSFKAFSGNSRYFKNPPPWFLLDDLHKIALYYGGAIQPERALGYKNGQLLLGFSHNTPDNTLPIFWDEGHKTNWHPVFVRYDKVYQ